MRIKRLELKAFGPFTDRILDFSSDLPGLHVVFGPNEAGKSSSLRALQALFFGFPVRTDDNFLHPYDQLLVGGCLQGNDGRELLFYRRKRNKNSLFDDQDQLLDPAALSPFLHGLEQDLFTTLYGIDHETLVRGGQNILDQQGDVGQALFSAGTGLASLKTIVDDLEGEGDRLFKPRGSSQAIAVALARYKELQVQLKEVTLSSRDWQEHQRMLQEALQTQQEIKARRAALAREKQQLERLQQALPAIGQRRVLRQKLRELGQVVELAGDFSERRRELEQQRREARNRLETARTRHQERREQCQSLCLDQKLLDRAESIEELHQGLGQYRKARSDRPQLEGRRIGCRTEAAQLLKQIRPGLSIDEVEALRPSLAKRKTIQTLGARQEALLQGLHKTQRLTRKARINLQSVADDLQKLPPAVEFGGLARALRQVQRVGDLDGEIAKRLRQLEVARQACQAALQRLGLWAGSLEEVPHLALPLTETVQRFEEDLQTLSEDHRQIQREQETIVEERVDLEEQLQSLEQAAEVPSEEDLHRHRTRRDKGWQLLRRQWLKSEEVLAESREYDPKRALPEAYELAVERCDQTADRLYREADRVQKHAALKARSVAVETRLAALKLKDEQISGLLQAIQDRWRQLWQPCAIKPLSPREMQAWLGAFETLRFQVSEVDKAHAELQRCQTDRQQLRSLLLEELTATVHAPKIIGEDLAPLVELAEDRVQCLQREQSQRLALQEKLRDLEKTLETARQEQTEAEEDMGRWQGLWQEAVQPLAMESQIQPVEVADFMETLQRCFDQLRAADEFRVRIKGIDRDTADFENFVAEVIGQIATDLAGVEVSQAVPQLKSRLAQASTDQALLRQYRADLETLEQIITVEQRELHSIEELITEMRRLAGCDTVEQLDEAERRSASYRQLQEKLTEVESALARIGGGVPLSDLEQQAGAIDPDELPGRLETLTRDIEDTLDPEIQQLSETIGREKNELARMDGSGKAADLADDSQQELAKIRRLTERYIRIKLAGSFLQQEIERYRAENQDPVLSLASRYFNELTLGSFAGLRTDLDDQGQPILIGLRPEGNWVRVGGMSSGTRDQLYLALRLATLEWRIQSREPMPFIVDDILINFDDQRSQATLKAFRQLADKTQVILFTHHRQICRSAQQLQGDGRVFVHSLQGGSTDCL